MGIPGVPAEGLKTVGQITPTNAMQFRVDQDAASIGADMVKDHATGGPVVDTDGRIVGFISEIDLLEAVRAGHDLRRLQAADVMTRCPISVLETASLSDAIDVMASCHLLNLPVQRNGVVSYSITRHDLLRAAMGLGPGMEGV